MRATGTFFAVLTIALYAYSTASAAAQVTQIEGVSITQKDLDQLFAAFRLALKPNDHTIPILIDIKKSSEMPAYDPQYHYIGATLDAKGARTFEFWVNGDLQKADLQNAITSGVFLAITDGGYAGSAFKSLYDLYQKEDSQLPANAPDPFLRRQKFAAALVKLLNESTQ
jgi:hypothetical protein